MYAASLSFFVHFQLTYLYVKKFERLCDLDNVETQEPSSSDIIGNLNSLTVESSDTTTSGPNTRSKAKKHKPNKRMLLTASASL